MAEAPFFWSRDSQGGARLTREEGEPVLGIEYPGEQDWACYLSEELPVHPEDRLRVAVRLKALESDYDGVQFSCILWDEGGTVLTWGYAPLKPRLDTADWQELAATYVLPRNAAKARFRLTGNAPCKVLLSCASVEEAGNLLAERPPLVLEPVVLADKRMQVTIEPDEWRFSFLDKQSGVTWRTFKGNERLHVVAVGPAWREGAVFEALALPSQLPVELRVELGAGWPWVSLTTSAEPDAEVSWELATVPPLVAPGPGSELVVPLNEGVLLPADDPSLPTYWQAFYCGQQLSMPWLGVMASPVGAAVLVMAADDVSADDAYSLTGWRDRPEAQCGTSELWWQPQRGRWGYDRKAQWQFAPQGGYAALAKAYWGHIEWHGKGRPLYQKLDDKRLGLSESRLRAPVLWLFLRPSDAKQKQEALEWLADRGVKRLLVEFDSSPDNGPDKALLERGGALGFVTSRYDNYLDAFDPEEQAKAGLSYPSAGFPEGLVLTDAGSRATGWVLKEGRAPVTGNLVCSAWQRGLLEERVPEELARLPYSARFIDTTTAVGLVECYDPGHLLTRTEDRENKLALFERLGELGLATGSETAGDWAAGELAWSEGLMSLGPWRHPEAGYLPSGLAPNPEQLEWQLNPARRVPLWELVHHQDVVATWYWGDCQTTFPSLWARRDLFSALYGTPPLFVVKTTEDWERDKERIAASCLAFQQLMAVIDDDATYKQIGRASCRERV